MNTEELILNEEKIDWDALSADPNRSFSLAEIRMFRKRINWLLYLNHHNLSHDEMTIASKHFTQDIYDFIALRNLADQDFIQDHLKDFNWRILLRASYLSPETLKKMFLDNPTDFSKDAIENYVLQDLKKNKLINLHDGSYDDFLLYTEINL